METFFEKSFFKVLNIPLIYYIGYIMSNNNYENPVMNPPKSYLDYLILSSRVFKDKAWYTVWHFDLFTKVDRCYPKESYYSNFSNLISLPANHIIDNLYLGSAFNAADYNWLKANDIEIIVNATPSISNYYPNEIEYHNYKIKDLNDANLGPFYQKFYQLVEKNPNRKILVHCFAGKSRSASLILFYIMKKYQYNMDQALEIIKKYRPCINVNCTFIDEINSLLIN